MSEKLRIFSFHGIHKDPVKNPEKIWHICSVSEEAAFQKLTESGVQELRLLFSADLGPDWRT